MLVIGRAAVLGAGRMGTAVAAHLANAGIPTLLLDLAPTELTEEEQRKGLDLAHPTVRNRLATAAVTTAAKGRPAAFAHPSRTELLTPGNFEDDLAKLAEVDWVVEAVVERLDVKQDLLARVAECVGPKTIVSTNSSGLSVNAMASVLPDELKKRFVGTHFFFPPRYMYLLELIPGEKTDPAVIEGLKEFAELRLGKGVVLSEDTPNFVANRIGIFSTVYAINAMDKYGLSIEEVDAASGRALARSVTATYGTSNLAGTDVLAFAVDSHYKTAVDDEMREQWRLPQWILDMVDRGYLGEKTGGSFFREKRTLVIDPKTLEYVPWQDPRQPSIAEANKISDPVERVKKFISFDDEAARFGWDLLAATFVYSANRVPEICSDIAQIDRGMRWGYAWDLGPFELWDALGVKETVERMKAEGRAVPEWVAALAASDSPFFYKKEAGALSAWGPGQKEHKPLAARSRVISLASLKAAGKTLDECKDASLIDLGDRVACIEYHTKANVVTEDIHLFTEKALAEAGGSYDALVIGNEGAHFSGGADLGMMLERIRRQDWDAIDATLRNVQRVSMRMKYAPIPIVAAPFGRVLGGGGRGLPPLPPGTGARRRQHGAGGDERRLGSLRRGDEGSRVPHHGAGPRRELALFHHAAVVPGHHHGQNELVGLGSLRSRVPPTRRRRDHESRESHLRGQARGAGHAGGRLAATLAGQDQSHGRRRHGQLPVLARQHARERLHLGARSLSLQQGGLGALRRRS